MLFWCKTFILSYFNFYLSIQFDCINRMRSLNAQFECWMEDDRQTDTAERRVYENLNLTT